MNLERTGGIVFTSRLLTSAIGFVGTIYYARELGPATIGVFFLLQSLVGILSVPGDLGVQGAAEKRISEGGGEHKLFSAALVILFTSFFSISVITFLFSESINSYLGMSLFWELLAVLLATMLVDLFLAVLRGELKIEYSALLSAVKALTVFVVSVGLILQGLEIHALIYGVLSGSISTSILAIVLTDLAPAVPDLEHFKRIYSFSKYNMVLRTSGLIYGWADTIIIGFFLSSTSVGVYEIAWRISTISIIASTAVSQVIFPNFSKLHAEGDIEAISEVIPNAIIYSLIIPIAIFFGSLVLAEDVLRIAYGPAFESGALVLIILSAERVIHSYHTVIYNVTMAFDQPDIAFKFSMLSLTVNIVLNVILVQAMGIEGAAIAMLIAYTLNAILYYQHTRHQVSINLPVEDIGWITVSATVMALCVIGIENRYQASSIASLALLIFFGGLIYLVALSFKKNFRQMATSHFSGEV